MEDGHLGSKLLIDNELFFGKETLQDVEDLIKVSCLITKQFILKDAPDAKLNVSNFELQE